MDEAIMDEVITAKFRKAHIRTLVCSSCHVCYNKMRAYALYGIQPTCELISMYMKSKYETGIM